jgi:2',3'-cyclic-nucleotide 2'-phosphodiesterase (5'-nucleotidase family)
MHTVKMKRMLRQHWPGILLLILTVLPSPVYADSDEIRVAILHVNDTHGRLLPRRRAGGEVGGYARLATAIGKVREESDLDHVLLVHAGDILSRGDKLTRRTKGAANVALMNELGFDLWTPGNGEFYDGLDVLTQRIGEFDGKVLTSNVYRSDTRKPLGVSSAVLEAGDLRIAFIGSTTVRKANRDGLVVGQWATVSAELVGPLREKAHAVVAVNHIGYPYDRALAELVGGIDLIIGGHTHTLLPNGKWVHRKLGGRTLIAQAGGYVKHLGRVDMTFRRDGDTWGLVEMKAGLIPLDAKVRPDETIRKRIVELTRESTGEQDDKSPKPRQPALDAAPAGR